MLPPALERRRDTRTDHCSLHAVEGNTNVEEIQKQFGEECEVVKARFDKEGSD